MKIDAKMLKGLKYHWAEGKAIEKDGKRVMEYERKERDLTPEDIIGSKDYGDHIVIVTADGNKYRLPKSKKEE